MKPISNNLSDLKEKAVKFQFLLEEYARKDSDVQDFLERIKPWFHRIERGEITLPCNEYQLFQYFGNPDFSPLSERYKRHKLGRAEATFSCAIRGW